MSLTKKQKAKYIKAPYVCPKCGSDDIGSGNYDFDHNQVWSDVACNACQFSWRDIYTLTDIEEA